MIYDILSKRFENNQYLKKYYYHLTQMNFFK